MKLFVTFTVLLELVGAVEAFRWTLHKSCYEKTEYKDAILTGMETAKSRSAFAASRIDSFLHPNFKKLGQILIGKDDFTNRAKTLKTRFENFKNLNGPIGKDSNFADSAEWTGRENPTNADFVIYCAPDVGEIGDLNPIPIDNARQYILGAENPLILINKDIAAKGWHDENKKVGAVTNNAKPNVPTSEDEIKKIPDTITLNPIWLDYKIANGGLLFNPELLTDLKKEGALDVMKETWEDNKRATPVDTPMGDLASTLHHEIFHLSAFGSHKDLPSDEPERAYNWMNNVERKLIDNPELMAFLGLIFELREKHKATVTEAGDFEK
ncbi:hypothetical protein F66182_7104 [Fusarium sp. NRRL 66182]|nr:hypothetical protein F66182_7104 [Fusarium sp. NRRL 66182]